MGGVSVGDVIMGGGPALSSPPACDVGVEACIRVGVARRRGPPPGVGERSCGTANWVGYRRGASVNEREGDSECEVTRARGVIVNDVGTVTE